MKATIEMDFPTPALAKAAEKALEKAASKARVRAGVAGNSLKVEITAADFTALRARATSAFRDLRVITDAMKLAGAKGRHGGI